MSASSRIAYAIETLANDIDCGLIISHEIKRLEQWARAFAKRHNVPYCVSVEAAIWESLDGTFGEHYQQYIQGITGVEF